MIVLYRNHIIHLPLHPTFKELLEYVSIVFDNVALDLCPHLHLLERKESINFTTKPVQPAINHLHCIPQLDIWLLTRDI